MERQLLQTRNGYYEETETQTYSKSAVFKTRRLVFIFINFAQNGTIKELVEHEKKPLKESQAKVWFKQIMDGLSYMHSKYVAH